jgi:colanic acid biosynthesis glycosyl transferase WcaI
MSDPAPSAAKIVFLNRYFDPDESATSQMLTDLARGLVGRGMTVHVVCSRQLYTDAAAQLPASENRSGVTVHRVATTRYGRARLIGRSVDYASFYLGAGLELMKLLRASDVVIAKTDPPLISMVAAAVARLKRATLVNWQQDVFPEVASALGANPLPRWLDSSLRRLRDASLRSAAVNVVIGKRMHDYFCKRGIPRDRLCVIENWADSTTIRPKSSGASELRARLGLKDRFVVGYSGNLGRAHEFDTLIEAARVLREDSRIAFLIVGGGAKMEGLRRSAAQSSLDSFHFLPYQPRESLGDSLAAADVHLATLLPALEGLIVPSKLYGILAAGRPLIFIGDRDGDIARVIAAARCGLTVGVGGGSELADIIRRLQSDPADCAAMGARAREAFEARHTLEKAVDLWLGVLRISAQQVGIERSLS